MGEYTVGVEQGAAQAGRSLRDNETENLNVGIVVEVAR